MLKHIACWCQAFGCALWQTKPNSNVRKEPPEGELFVLAEYFPPPVRFAMHDLPIAGSWTGEVVSKNRAKNIPDVSVDPLRSKNRTFVEEHGLGPMISVPFQCDESTWGALNVYRQKSTGPFDDSHVSTLELIAAIIPQLYEASRERAGFRLLQVVDKTIRDAESQPVMSLVEKRVFLEQISVAIGESFHALETSIYLSYPPEDEDRYSIQATTWLDGVEKEHYKAEASDGITGWILANQRPVRLFHLPDYADGSPRRGDEYKGLTWRRSPKFLTSVRRLLGGNSDRHPATSFMGVPIVAGDTILGAIRCCVAKESPYFFSEPDLELLKLVAAQIGQCWSSWLARTELVEDSKAWQSVVNETNRLNSLAQSQLADRPEQETTLMKNALRAFSQSVSGGNSLAIRLFDEQKSDLYYAVTRGELWHSVPAAQSKKLLAVRYPIGKRTSTAIRSIGEHVFRNREVYEATDLATDPYFGNRRYFPGVRSKICAPISVGDSVFGVLDIVFSESQPTPRHAKAFAELLGRQLGLYLSLSRSMAQLRQAERDSKEHVRELETLQSELKRTFEDLSHQLKGPLRLAIPRADRALKLAKSNNDAEASDLLSEVRAVHGLLRRTQRVAESLRIIAELERQRELNIRPTRLLPSILDRLLIEAADDTYEFVKPIGIHLHVQRESYGFLATREVLVDLSLLEQSIGNIYDNAAKYSYEGSHIDICGGITKSGRFHITISNTGIPIGPDEIKQCKKRGWRGDDAFLVAGDGSGIGLWIVSHIMDAHGGDLVIEPTDENGMTVVKLVFPFVSRELQ